MIIIVDNGSQYTHLIKRTCCDLGKDAEIVQDTRNENDIGVDMGSASAIIISGGPSSVYKKKKGLSEILIDKIFNQQFETPLLGICFGHQLIAHLLGGKVKKGKSAEYGLTKIKIDDENDIFEGIPKSIDAWASHFDEVSELPEDFISLAHSDCCAYEAMAHKKKKIYGLQFHPEVWHTQYGEKILENFLKIK